MKYILVLLFVLVIGIKSDTVKDITGDYKDPNHPEGYRHIELSGEWKLNVVGKDDEKSEEWRLKGRICPKTLHLSVDFTPKAP